MMDELLVKRAASANGLFRHAVAGVRGRGTAVAPRGLPTIEVLGAVLQLSRPRARFVHLAPARVLNPAFAVAEAVWILAGTDAPWIYDYNGRLRKFADDGVLRGAYGVRMRRWGPAGPDQLARVVELLTEDPDTRRAVIQLYDPTKDAAGHRDVPCTLSYRFHLRNGRLNMSTTMRSQDVWLGLPYDLFSATVIHELVAGWVGAELGTYNLSVDSLHLYESDLDGAALVRGVRADVDSLVDGDELADLAVPFDEFDDVLAAVIDGRSVGHQGWDTFGATMRSYRIWKHGDRQDARQVATDLDGPFCRYLTSWYDKLEAPARQNGSR